MFLLDRLVARHRVFPEIDLADREMVGRAPLGVRQMIVCRAEGRALRLGSQLLRRYDDVHGVCLSRRQGSCAGGFTWS
jgi:hypothetical protein